MALLRVEWDFIVCSTNFVETLVRAWLWESGSLICIRKIPSENCERGCFHASLARGGLAQANPANAVALPYATNMVRMFACILLAELQLVFDVSMHENFVAQRLRVSNAIHLTTGMFPIIYVFATDAMTYFSFPLAIPR